MNSAQLARALFTPVVGSHFVSIAATASSRVAFQRASARVHWTPALPSRNFAGAREVVSSAIMSTAEPERKRSRSSSPAAAATAQSEGQEAVKKARIDAEPPSQSSSSAKGKQVDANGTKIAGKSQESKPIKPGKVTDRPLSGIFAVNKPSGRTSMSLLEDLKPLFASSSLFKDADGKASDLAKRIPGGWRGRSARKKLAKGDAHAVESFNFPPKLGQGGTLDPLADGVLGEWQSHTIFWRIY